MILRAVGYDKNGEFTGADWALNVAKYAEQAGVLKNIKGVDLNAPATRELVAEMLFRGIADAATVTYTPAFGYQTEKVQKLDKVTLGSKNFKLADKDASDDWGRPGTKWTYNTGDEETLVLKKAAATYTTKVDECDIAKDLGITKSKAIEAAYIDGDKQDITDKAVTTNQVGTINALATTSYVGGQGRLTEVYDMGADGYRIVEINTYLAKVDKVTAAKTDRNGHTTKATVDVTVYCDKAYKDDQSNKMVQPTWTFTKVEAEGFTVDQYVLVTVLNPKDYKANADKNKASVESIVAAELVAGGKLTGWTNEVGTTAATSVVAGTTYNDANKFFLGWRETGTKWLVALDSYGNAIGLVENASSYATVARIEWRPNANSFGGYALADLVLADGTLKENVTVSSVGDKSVNGVKNGKDVGVRKDASVALYWNNNTAYYEHVVTYTVNADGSYNLMYNDHNGDVAKENVKDLYHVDYDKGSASLGGEFTVTNSTVFAYINENGYSYTVYTGKNNAPSFTDGKLCVKFDDNGYAEFVVVYEYEDASNTFLAYVTDKEFDGYEWFEGTKTEGYDVYKLGETKATRVYEAEYNSDDEVVNTHAFTTKYKGMGVYKITVNNDGWVVGMDKVTVATVNDTYKDGAAENTYVDYGYVYKDPKLGSFQLADKDATDNSDIDRRYNVDDEKTVYINVLVHTKWIELETGSKDDVKAGSPVFVTYDEVYYDKTGIANAEVVYVIKDASDVETPVTAPSLTLKQNAPGQVQATYKSGSKATSVYVEYYYREAGDTSAKWNVLYTGTEHNYAADGSEVYSAKDLPTLGGSNKYDVYAVAYATKDLADYNKGDVVATSNTLKDVIA